LSDERLSFDFSELTKISPHSFEDVHIDDQRHQAPKQLVCNEQMLLESMMEDGDSTAAESSASTVNKAFLLLDGQESLTVSVMTIVFSSLMTSHVTGEQWR
jgi:hypothetical protein